MHVIVGKTASGKDTILNKLIEKYGYKRIVTYTSRPMRSGEVDGKTYRFISKEEFKEKIESGFFLEYRKYETVDGDWYYGSAKEDFAKADKNTIMILTPSGLSALKVYIARQKVDIDIKSIYIYSNLSTIRKRLKKRGDNKEEAERRIKADIEDFNGVTEMVDTIIYNNDKYNLEEVVEKVHRFIEKE